MHFSVVTLFPDLFEPFLTLGILGRAHREGGAVSTRLWDPRSFTKDSHRTVDDTPYGGGSGMVLMPGPVVSAIRAANDATEAKSLRVLLTPQGKVFQQSTAERWSKLPAITLVCGRYEGFDERIRSHVDEEVSMGDFVLLGGEVAAMAMMEATARLCPGVIGNSKSLEDESHQRGLLEYPQYTRPTTFEGQSVPEVLLSGDHGKIRQWREDRARERTRERRPDLFAQLKEPGSTSVQATMATSDE